LAGWPFAAISFGLFLGPLILAVTGAVLFDLTAGWQLFGAVVGLVGGMAASVAAWRLSVAGRKGTVPFLPSE